MLVKVKGKRPCWVFLGQHLWNKDSFHWPEPYGRFGPVLNFYIYITSICKTIRQNNKRDMLMQPFDTIIQ
ncbi:hypothetical protein HanRHA438_Chr04g0192741 [Helianthus annuus]|nr:hypothetical protein HanRHA438_Chr04g0192741 [Helianthus annuus]